MAGISTSIAPAMFISSRMISHLPQCPNPSGKKGINPRAQLADEPARSSNLCETISASAGDSFSVG